MPFNDSLPAENTDPWYVPITSAWANLKTFVNGLETQVNNVTLDSLVDASTPVVGEKAVVFDDGGGSITTTVRYDSVVFENGLLSTAVTPEEINFRNTEGRHLHVVSPETLGATDVTVTFPSMSGALALEGSVTLDSLVQPGGSTVNGTNKYVNLVDDAGNLDVYSTISYENVILRKLSDSASVTLTSGGVTALNQSLSTNIVGSEVSVNNFDAGSQTSITAGTVSLDDGQGNRGTITTPATGGTLTYGLPPISGPLLSGQNGVSSIWVGTSVEYAALGSYDPTVLYFVKD